MFTGIVSDTTTVRAGQLTDKGRTLSLARPPAWIDLQLGESVSVNGACLTVAALRDDEFDCFAVPETLDKTSFGTKLPERVNLERSLKVTDRFGGHFVTGHVDNVSQVTKIDQTDGYWLTVRFNTEFRDLVLYKGSITINGVSLTIAEATKDSLRVTLIPHTLEHTTLSTLQVGDQVNLEFDVLGKYVLNSQKVRSDHATGSNGDS